MKKLGILASLSAIVAAISIASFTSSTATAGDGAPAAAPCVRKEFKTDMVKEACAKGGQTAAKDAMKAFNKEKKIKSCNQCHTKLAPSFDLKKDAYEQFEKLGGK